jgi:hemerythrin-like domain-containing protein
MDTIADTLTRDHEHCDSLFATAENAVADADWGQATLRFEAFRTATLLHFEREENILFPDFETRTGMHGGPTFVMRAEHTQMRDTLEAMGRALDRREADAYLGQAETLLMLMRQHNMKEEQFLYPMADQALVDAAEDVVRAMRRLDRLPEAGS